MTSGIYAFVNKINGKMYIGQSQNIEKRLYDHEYTARKGKEKCTALQRAFDKYGFDNFSVEILEECSISDLNEREIFYIQKFQSNNKKFGYNLSSGGESGLRGYKFPESFGKKISEAKKGWIMSDSQKEFISRLHKGKIVSKETRRKMSENNVGFIGRTHTDETKQKMSESHTGERAHQFGKKSANASSQYFGVCKSISKGHIYWSAGLKVNHKSIHIGASKDEIEAAKMYDKYVIEHDLPNPLNFPD